MEIQELMNRVQMLAKQSKNVFLTEKERKDIIKSELKCLETLQSKINWRIMELNNELRVKKELEIDDL